MNAAIPPGRILRPRLGGIGPLLLASTVADVVMHGGITIAPHWPPDRPGPRLPRRHRPTTPACQLPPTAVSADNLQRSSGNGSVWRQGDYQGLTRRRARAHRDRRLHAHSRGRQHQLKTAKLQTLLSQHVTDPRLALRELDRQLSEAIHDLMAAGRGHRLLWVKRGALATVGVGALGIAAQLEPGYQMTWLLAGLSSIAINVATGLSRPRPPGTWAYLHHLHRTFPTAQSPA